MFVADNSNRVRLRPLATSGTEYINASFVDVSVHVRGSGGGGGEWWETET